YTACPVDLELVSLRLSLSSLLFFVLCPFSPFIFFFFFFNDTATTEIYTLSLHDALPIFIGHGYRLRELGLSTFHRKNGRRHLLRSEEHTSKLQSLTNLVCRLLLEKKKKKKIKKILGKTKTLL